MSRKLRWMLLVLGILGAMFGGVSSAQAKDLVAEIRFQGLGVIPKSLALSYAANTQVGQPFSAEAAKKDVQALSDSGYFKDIRADVLKNKAGDYVLVFKAQANPLIMNVEFEGVSAFTPEELLRVMVLKREKTYNPHTLKRDVEEILRLYSEKGFVGAQLVKADLKLTNPKNYPQIVTLCLTFAEGTVRKVEVEGAKAPAEIQKAVSVKPGESLSEEKLKESLGRLENSENYSEVGAEVKANPDNTLDVKFVLKEKPLYSWELGGAINSLDGPVLVGGIERRELFGHPQKVGVGLRLGEDLMRWTLRYKYIPLNGKNKYTADIVHSSKKESDGALVREGSLVMSGRTSVGPGWWMLTGLSLEQTSEDASDYNIVSLGGEYSSLDEGFFPVSGLRALAQMEVSTSFLGSDADFTKYRLEVETAKKLKSATLYARANGVLASHAVPETQKEDFGGPVNLRGYSGLWADSGLVLVGEIRKDLGDKFYLAAFAEAGAVKNDGVAQGPLFDGGIGGRVKTPLGTFRIDFGLGRDGSQTWVGLEKEW